MVHIQTTEKKRKRKKEEEEEEETEENVNHRSTRRIQTTLDDPSQNKSTKQQKKRKHKKQKKERTHPQHSDGSPDSTLDQLTDLMKIPSTTTLTTTGTKPKDKKVKRETRERNKSLSKKAKKNKQSPNEKQSKIRKQKRTDSSSETLDRKTESSSKDPLTFSSTLTDSSSFLSSNHNPNPNRHCVTKSQGPKIIHISEKIHIAFPAVEAIVTPTITTTSLPSSHSSTSSSTRITQSEDTRVGGRIVSSSAKEFQPILVETPVHEEKDHDPTHNRHVTISSDLFTHQPQEQEQHRGITLVLFYQYIEPPWKEEQFQDILSYVQNKGEEFSITGRMRVAHEGLNCTLTGSYSNVRKWCRALRDYKDGLYFSQTEFKLTDDLPPGQAFPKLHAFKVEELVHYGLAGDRAPSISMTGVHLEPEQYHAKLAEANTVVIDVRNHYEANIGRFDPPNTGAMYIDPNMRKSTEFPIWLDKPSTKEMLRGKQVLMYCTGGVRCERASALLRTMMETDEDVKALGIQGVYQLQGGIDKYFKNYPDGGYWKGKNYVFDKRFAHAPPLLEGIERAQKLVKQTLEPTIQEQEKVDVPSLPNKGEKVQEVFDHNRNPREEDDETSLKRDRKCKSFLDQSSDLQGNETEKIDPVAIVAATVADSLGVAVTPTVMGKCEACRKPWDKYRGKRRCPTCGVPSLICKSCYDEDIQGIRKLRSFIRCDLCVAENITSKKQLSQRIEKEQEEFEQKWKLNTTNNTDRSHTHNKKREKYLEKVSRGKNDSSCAKPTEGDSIAFPVQGNTTRVCIKNMCVNHMDEETLCQHVPGITHIQWMTDRQTGKWYGSAFVEMKTPADALNAVTQISGQKILGRPIKITFSPPNPKDVWPLPSTKVG